jgi:nicotinate-nucleotide adenylyltransferase
MKTGIIGGTFNPIHNAHLLIAECAREQFGLDSVWFMTSGNPPHKRGMNLESARVRQDMVRVAIKDNPYFELCSYEVEREEYSYTANTLTEFSEKYPDREFYFIIGADSLEQMSSWYKPEVIAAHSVILVFGRRGAGEMEAVARQRRAELNADIRIIDAPLFDVSSSMIRRRAAEGQSIRYMVPREVEKYIMENGLYKATQEVRDEQGADEKKA